jgi:hypothetical protein
MGAPTIACTQTGRALAFFWKACTAYEILIFFVVSSVSPARLVKLAFGWEKSQFFSND